MSRRALAALTIAAALLASCGGDEDRERSSLSSGHRDVLVIEGWIEALSRGDVRKAASYFALPSVAENGTAPVTLRSTEDIIAFNRSLPCGAKLVRAEPLGRFIAATFRLTDRPGGGCGGGAGQLARTAFVIKDGKIVQWRRLLGAPRGEGGGAAGGGPIV